MPSTKQRHVAGFLICGVIAYAVGMICMLPASLIDRYLNTHTDGIVRLADARGTVWAGEGYVELRDSEKPAAPQQYVTWRFVPDSVWNGHLGFGLNLNHSAQTTSVAIGLSSLTLRNAAFQLPAAALALAIPKLAPLGLQGDLSIQIEDMQFDGNQTAGNARLEWMRAGSAMTTVSPLGHYKADLLTQESVIKVALMTLNGPLQLDGEGSWALQSAPNFSGKARIPASLHQQLSPMLRLISNERAPGEFDIQIR
jgi:general secretion pathway protein N